MKIVLEAKKIKIINENIHNYLQYILSEDVLEKKMAWERNIFCFEQDIKKIKRLFYFSLIIGKINYLKLLKLSFL